MYTQLTEGNKITNELKDYVRTLHTEKAFLRLENTQLEREMQKV